MDPQQPDDGWLSFQFDAAPDVPVEVSPADTPAWPELEAVAEPIFVGSMPEPPRAVESAPALPEPPEFPEPLGPGAAPPWPDLPQPTTSNTPPAPPVTTAPREPLPEPQVVTVSTSTTKNPEPELVSTPEPTVPEPELPQPSDAPERVIDPPFYRSAAAPREVELDLRQGYENPRSVEVSLPRDHQEYRGTEAASTRLDDQQREMGEALDQVIGSIVRHLEQVTQTLYAHAMRLDDLDSGSERRGAY